MTFRSAFPELVNELSRQSGRKKEGKKKIILFRKNLLSYPLMSYHFVPLLKALKEIVSPPVRKVLPTAKQLRASTLLGGGTETLWHVFDISCRNTRFQITDEPYIETRG